MKRKINEKKNKYTKVRIENKLLFTLGRQLLPLSLFIALYT